MVGGILLKMGREFPPTRKLFLVTDLARKKAYTWEQGPGSNEQGEQDRALGGKEMEPYGWKSSTGIFIVLKYQDGVLSILDEVL